MFNVIPKSFFFDRKRVQDAIEKKTSKALGHIGGWIRKTAQRSIRNRGRVSRPGEAPTNWTHKLRDYIFFAFDATRSSVVIGPVKFNQVDRQADGTVAPGLAPETLEFGGKVGFFERLSKNNRWYRVDQRSRRRLAGVPTRTRFANYQARPYMGPAMRKAIGSRGLARYWANGTTPPSAA